MNCICALCFGDVPLCIYWLLIYGSGTSFGSYRTRTCIFVRLFCFTVKLNFHRRSNIGVIASLWFLLLSLKFLIQFIEENKIGVGHCDLSSGIFGNGVYVDGEFELLLVYQGYFYCIRMWGVGNPWREE